MLFPIKSAEIICTTRFTDFVVMARSIYYIVRVSTIYTGMYGTMHGITIDYRVEG